MGSQNVRKSHMRRQLINLGTTTTTAPAATTTATSSRPQMPAPTGPGVTLTHTTETGKSTSTSGTSGTSTVTSGTSTSTTATSATTTFRSAVQVTRTSTQRVSSTSSAPTTTGTGDDSTGMGLGSVAGLAVAGLIGIGVCTAFIVWLIRRRNRRNRNRDIDNEPFNRQSFLRHSVAIPDEDHTPGPFPSRRPAPEMIERQPTPSYGNMPGYNNAPPPPNAFGYNTQPSYQPDNMMYTPNSATGFGPGGVPATPLPYSPGYGAPYNQNYPAPGGYAELTRGGYDDPASAHFAQDPAYYGQQQLQHPQLDNPYASPPHSPLPPAVLPKDGNMHGDVAAVPMAGQAVPVAPAGHPANGPNSDIYTPAPYPELTPPTASAQQGRVVAVPEAAYAGRETPVQLGFVPAQNPNAHHQQQQHNVHAKNGRPESAYDADDAYGGI